LVSNHLFVFQEQKAALGYHQDWRITEKHSGHFSVVP